MADSAFNVNSFKSKLANGGARPSLFQVSWTDTAATFPLAETQALLVKAASLPTSTIAPLVQNYAGRAYKLQGFRTFDNWTVTILNDEGFTVRNQIKQWMEGLSGAMDGTRAQGTKAVGPAGSETETFDTIDSLASGTATVTQMTQNGIPSKSYKFYNLWPTELAGIPLDWGSDMVEEFSVTFAYDYWTSGTTTSGTAGYTNDVNTGKPSGTGAPTSAASTTG
jgi:hypothetical protein